MQRNAGKESFHEENTSIFKVLLDKSSHKKLGNLSLHISKAFDSVSWVYLLVVLLRLGFGKRLICLTLASSSSRILLNRSPGLPFSHARGLRQDDPLSPVLFILAIDSLQQILQLASHRGILKLICSHTTSYEIPAYVDDADILANPDKEELRAISAILRVFEEASGLITKLAKSEVFPIRCGNFDLTEVLSTFKAKIASFPGRLSPASLLVPAQD